ncbi:Helicase associated domain protein [Streptomyces samsunensis]|uniref:DEAD/DEAH box helicase n=1 Tax=Streptomyces malaysiensis TaxID=92644 RepID=UPI001583BAC2|nr:DEAD/DEAH box helicase [Streptomyces samsunensis]NUH42925.1 Helicase associated domain protein [Streptomyces samsunensis]
MQKKPDVVQLRPHQVEAVDAIVRGLDIPPGRRIPHQGLRATAVSACGTGKTLMAAASAHRLVPRGRVLVLVPTLDLLTQTVASWRAAGHTGPAVAVCSLHDDPAMWSAQVRTTTSAPQLAFWHGSGPVTVYATYASLPVLAAACEGVYGLKMDAFDLAVVDEAHRTSGSLGKAWADIHDNDIIPAARRLYMTATPRIWQERPSWEVREGARDPLPEELAASMDDESIFGPTVFELGLADAIARGLLARYQIIVVEVTDPEVTPAHLKGEEGREERIRGLRLGALHAAILRTAVDNQLQTMITFHHRTVEAEAFAEGLPAVAKKLHAADPGRYPANVWSGWLHGEHEADHRRKVLADFGTRAGLAVLSNCKVLGEGVDIRAVDSVALLDPKGSAVDIVQAIGRALRQQPGAGKLASLVVPVFLAPGEEPEDMFTSASYQPLIKVLQGLRAHDERAVELLATPETNTERLPAETIGAAPDEGEEESRMLLRFSAPRDPVMVAEWVSFNVIDVERQDWARGYAAARRYREREGDLLVPYGYVEPETSIPLGQWIAKQRNSYKGGAMSGKRAERLEGLGMVWSATDLAWEENLAAIRTYAEQTGTLAAPRGASALGRPVGQLLANLRRAGGLGKDAEVAERRAAQLAAIDPDWNPEWPLDWQRHYAGLAALVDADGTLEEIQPGVTYGGADVGLWLERQRERWAALSEGQRERLAQLGVTAAEKPRQQKAPIGATAVSRGGSDAFSRGLAALRQYLAREGHLTVPRGHVEVLEGRSVGDGEGERVEVKLGVWLSNTKSRRAKLSADRLAVLAELGLTWAA